jgi:hypothetical protein|tara:strand:+ start:53 stop:661 length:609 start_codon:yes stop_codon:yes gene_type:complete
MSYFKEFPKVVINKQEVLDITRKVSLSSALKFASIDYSNYTLQDGDTPEMIAHYYYDDVELAWLVLLSNDIVDPYTQWYKTQEQLEEYIKVQYETQSGTTGDVEITTYDENGVATTSTVSAVLEWTKKPTIASNIVRYQSKLTPEIQINYATYIANPTAEFEVVRIYDEEYNLNESRRTIKLVNKSYLGFIRNRFKEVINGG